MDVTVEGVVRENEKCPDCGLRSGIVTSRHAHDCCLNGNRRAQKIVARLIAERYRLRMRILELERDEKIEIPDNVPEDMSLAEFYAQLDR